MLAAPELFGVCVPQLVNVIRAVCIEIQEARFYTPNAGRRRVYVMY